MKIFDIALKDLTQSFRSLFAVGLMFAAPLLITGLIYFAFGGLASGDAGSSLPDLNVVVVNQDQPTGDIPRLGELLVSYLQEDSMPDWLVTREMENEQDARAAVDRREAGVALIVPADFSDALLSTNNAANLTLVQDPHPLDRAGGAGRSDPIVRRRHFRRPYRRGSHHRPGPTSRNNCQQRRTAGRIHNLRRVVC